MSWSVMALMSSVGVVDTPHVSAATISYTFVKKNGKRCAADRGEGDIEHIEDVAERAVVARERLTLHHVDYKVEKDDKAKGPLPNVGCKKMLHAELREHIPVRQET